MLNEQLDLPDASRAGIAAVSERLKDLQWDSPGEQPHRFPPDVRNQGCCSHGGRWAC